MFRDNPHYVEYVKLLIALHKLMQRGECDSLEADEIRDQMDVPWYAMNHPEIERTGELSADLATLEPDSPFKHPDGAGVLTDSMRQALDAFLTADDWPAILRLLRERAPEIAFDTATFLRGQGWVQLGENEAGLRFLEFPTQGNPSVACAILRPLLNTAIPVDVRTST
ncbi:MAG: hypothetical protein K8T91_21110 [Planctomycetes bacterium]|nr:hypothetical protein [Planctomycetota bacterium]